MIRAECFIMPVFDLWGLTPLNLGWERNAQGSTDFMGWANEEQPQTSQESKGVAELLHQVYPSESELFVKSLKCCTQCFTIVKFREKQVFQRIR